MSALASAHEPGSRLSELSPFELEQRPEGAVQPQIPLPGPNYGCVEWFHYLEHPGELGEHHESRELTRQWRDGS